MPAPPGIDLHNVHAPAFEITDDELKALISVLETLLKELEDAPRCAIGSHWDAAVVFRGELEYYKRALNDPPKRLRYWPKITTSYVYQAGLDLETYANTLSLIFR